MGQPSLINDPFSWKEWFNNFINKIRSAGPHQIPGDHIRFMNHAFIAGWNSRGAAEDFLRQQEQGRTQAVINEMNQDVVRYGKEVEDEHDAMDDLMKDLNQNPNT